MRRPRLKWLLIAGAVLLALAIAACSRMPFESTTAGLPECGPQRAPCGSVSGRIITVLRGDSDGDVHVILASRSSKTYPGVTVIKLEGRLRRTPHLDVGRWIAAAGALEDKAHGREEINAARIVTYSRW